MSDLLKRAKSVAKKSDSKSKKTEIRQIVIEGNEVLSLIEIASLTAELKPLEDQHKTIVQNKLFDMWTQEMWDGKKKPDNFKAVIKKENGLSDASCNFIFKVNKGGLEKIVPREEDLPDGKTVQEVLIEIIVKQCDISQGNAKKFVNEEVEIKDKIALSDSFDEMYYSDNEVKKKIADLLLKYIQARSRSKTKKVSLEEFTDELENEALTTKQIVALKSGIEDRIFTYCDTLDQLRKLLNLCKVTKQVSNFEFAISDDMKTKHERHKAVVDKYLDIDSE